MQSRPSPPIPFQINLMCICCWIRSSGFSHANELSTLASNILNTKRYHIFAHCWQPVFTNFLLFIPYVSYKLLIFEFLRAVLLKTEFSGMWLWAVGWVVPSISNEYYACEMSGTMNPTTQHCIPESWTILDELLFSLVSRDRNFEGTCSFFGVNCPLPQ